MTQGERLNILVEGFKADSAEYRDIPTRKARRKSGGFCDMSTGVFRFPKIRAAEIAAQTVTDWLSRHPDATERVIYAVLSDRSREIYERVLS